MYTCNEIPRSVDKSAAWYRRIYPVPFRTSFTAENKDPQIVAKMTTPESKRTLFKLAMHALNKLIVEHNLAFPVPAAVASTLREYEGRNDAVMRFVSEQLEVTGCAEDRVLRSSVWMMYRRWCEDGGLRNVVTKNMLFDAIRKLAGVDDSQRHNGIRVFRGLRWTDPADDRLLLHI